MISICRVHSEPSLRLLTVQRIRIERPERGSHSSSLFAWLLPWRGFPPSSECMSAICPKSPSAAPAQAESLAAAAAAMLPLLERARKLQGGEGAVPDRLLGDGENPCRASLHCSCRRFVCGCYVCVWCLLAVKKDSRRRPLTALRCSCMGGLVAYGAGTLGAHFATPLSAHFYAQRWPGPRRIRAAARRPSWRRRILSRSTWPPRNCIARPRSERRRARPHQA